jgi:hypothetical protein
MMVALFLQKGACNMQLTLKDYLNTGMPDGLVSDDHHADLLKSFNWASRLCSTDNVDPSTIPLNDLINEDKPLDIQAINKLFVAYKREKKSSKPPLNIDLYDFGTYASRRHREIIHEFHGRESELLATLSSLSERVNSKARDLANHRMSKDLIFGKPVLENIIKDLENNITATYDLPFVDSIYLDHASESVDVMVSCNELVHFNTNHGINHTLPSAKYSIKIYLNTLEVRISSSCQNSRTVHGLMGTVHPHVNNSGGICLGEMKDRFAQAVEKRDFKDLVSLIHIVLSTFNYDDPYWSLGRYVERKAMLDDGKGMCSDCNYWPDECECDREEEDDGEF